MSEIAADSYEHVRLQKDGPVLTATITNPAKKNAVNEGISRDFATLWRDVDNDEGVRVVVLTGAGDAFCSGLDLSVLSGGTSPRQRREKGVAKAIRDRIFDILDCETPVIAKVRGPAYGMGVNIALACDFVIAADDARFCDSHVKNGIVAGDGGVPLFPLLIGFRRAKEMLMFGEPITGQEAAEIGLINKSVPDHELDAAVDAYAAKIVAGPPLALTWTKLSLNILLKQMTLGAFETSIAYDMLSVRTDDVKEGSRAFLERRPPEFTGR
jgi:enoyl-CoA hydratase